MGCKRIASLVALVTLAWSGSALAQETQSLTFLDAGKPAGSVPVSRYLDGGKSSVASTSTDGTVSIPIDALGFGKGETVVVWVRRCEDGRIAEVILTSANEDNPCPSDGEVGDACGCEKIGTFVVGDGPATFDLGRPSMLQRIGVGVGVDLYQWLNFEDVSGNAPGATMNDASSTSTGFNGFLEYPCRRFPVSLGLDFSYTMLDTRTTFPTVGNPQRVQTGDISYLSVGPYVRIGPQRGRIIPYGIMSMYYTRNEGDFVLDGLSEQREHTTWRGGFGGGILYPIFPKLALRAEGTYSTTFKDNDADDHVRWKLGLMYRGGGGYAP